MNAYWWISVVFAVGAVGGLLNCLHSGEFHLPHKEPTANVWVPGWIGQVFVGGFAALIMWGLYGPNGSYDLAGSQSFVPHWTLSQGAMSLLVGFGGGRFLTAELQKRILRGEGTGENAAKASLIEVLKKLLDEHQ